MRSFGWVVRRHQTNRSQAGRSLANVIALAVALSSLVEGPAHAQKRGPTAPPAPPPEPAPMPVPDVQSIAPTPVAAGGLTAEAVGQRAASTSYQAKAAQYALDSATAVVEVQWLNYLPRIGLVGRYTRLSSFTPPTLGSTTQGSLVGTDLPAGTPNPAPTVAVAQATALRIPLILDQYLMQATLTIPISDYAFRIGKAHAAATHSEEAARFQLVAARAKSYSDGKLAYFTWLRARGSIVVAEQSLAVARAHQKDADLQFSVGKASKADALRAQTQVSAAELSVERGKSGAALAERQVRIAVHARDEETIAPAESLDGPVPAAPANLKELFAEAQSNRPEIKSIERSAEAARKVAEVQRAGRYPVLSGFGDLTYANPNPRRFPARDEFFPTWALGAQVTWSPNDVLAAGAASTDAEARASALEAQKGAVRDAVDLEVTEAYQAIVEADASVAATERQLESSTEGYRVARELFLNGRGTATTLIDAEIVLAETRFENLNARVAARVGRIRLEHALGRDVRSASIAPNP